MNKLSSKLIVLARNNLILAISGTLIVGGIVVYVLVTKNTNGSLTSISSDANTESSLKVTSLNSLNNIASSNQQNTDNQSNSINNTQVQNSAEVQNKTSSTTSNDTPIPVKEPTPAVTPQAPKPQVLPNCTFMGGPHAGDNCPSTPTTSWSYSATWKCSNNGIYIPCGFYEDTTGISGYKYNNHDFCQFFYPSGYKIIQVMDYGKYSEVDCSTAIAM